MWVRGCMAMYEDWVGRVIGENRCSQRGVEVNGMDRGDEAVLLVTRNLPDLSLNAFVLVDLHAFLKIRYTP
jgi:hypothetical protein